jgi:hypothetical protein
VGPLNSILINWNRCLLFSRPHLTFEQQCLVLVSSKFAVGPLDSILIAWNCCVFFSLPPPDRSQKYASQMSLLRSRGVAHNP